MTPNDNSEIFPLNTLTYHTETVDCVDILQSNPEVFASVSDDSRLAIWDLRDLNKPTSSIQASPDTLSSVAFNPSNEYTFLTAGQKSGEIWLWDLRRLIDVLPLTTFWGHTHPVTTLSFSKLDPDIF